MRITERFCIAEVLEPRQIKGWLSGRSSGRISYILQQHHDGIPEDKIRESKKKKNSYKVF
jgi:hypothetical protein